MTFSVTVFVALLLFFYGLKLSAFFSGSETGFYRVSPLQLTLEKQRGDTVAARLFFFVTHPERFVATTLVGNNVANYVTTLAIGLIVGGIWTESSGAPEIVATILMTPIVFIFGELIPKSLYYRAPMLLLRSGSVGFRLFYFLFLPLSYPLILISRMISRLDKSDKRPTEVVFGRNRLYGVLEAGQREGLLTELQRTLAENLMQVADRPVSGSMWPLGSVRGISEASSVDELIRFSKRSDMAFVLLHAEGQPNEWKSVVRVADVLATGSAPRSVAQPLPEFESSTPGLEVLDHLCREFSLFGCIRREGEVVGVISRRTLISQLFRIIRSASPQLENLLTGSRS
jgi:CBS domain containing-hemolysin-like protein